MPVDIFVSGTVSPRRCGFAGHHIWESMHELPIFRHFPAAVIAGPHMTLGLANGVQRKPMPPLPGLRSRRHKSVKLLVTNVFIEWTGQVLTLPT